VAGLKTCAEAQVALAARMRITNMRWSMADSGLGPPAVPIPI
jgi:hypothetical protein